MISGYHNSILYSEMVWVWCVTGQCSEQLDTAYLHWPETVVMEPWWVAQWRTVWTASRSSGRRIAFLSLYIDTVMNAKFGKGAYTLSTFLNWDVFSQNPYYSLMCDLCHVFIVVSMSKLRNPTGEGAGHGDNITQQQSQFTAPGQQVH